MNPNEQLQPAYRWLVGLTLSAILCLLVMLGGYDAGFKKGVVEGQARITALPDQCSTSCQSAEAVIDQFVNDHAIGKEVKFK